ncbi:MAG: DUF998 domain-containing protein [Trueperaceae bacterium]
MTQALLTVGALAAGLFLIVVLVEGFTRRGYDPLYHTGSELALGPRGWIQTANFLVMGLAMLAFALGVYQSLAAPLGAALLAVFGIGLITAGVFRPDPIRGYPPGSATGADGNVTWQHQVHGIVGGPIAFLAIFGACLALASQLENAWRWYTLLTAGVGLVLTVSTAVAYTRDAANTGLVQRGLLLTYWAWIIALAVHLV